MRRLSGAVLCFAVVGLIAVSVAFAAPTGAGETSPAQGLDSGVRFTEVTTAAGVAFLHVDDVAPFSMVSAGVAWGDYDNDGDQDLYLTDMDRPNRLYRNNGDGSFRDVAVESGATLGNSLSAGAAWGDYDGDGDLDLFVGNDKRDGNALLRNDGGQFVNVAMEAGVFEQSQTTSASWGDFDGDGHLDLYVVNYAVCFGADCGVEAARDHLYHNRGDGTFEDWSDSFGPTTTMGGGFQAAWTDYDNDGDLDIYIVNDTRAFEYEFGRYNMLFRNEGRPGPGGWAFTDVSLSSGAGIAINSMGLGVGDLDNDGFMDFYISNAGMAALLHNQGDGNFVDVGPATGAAYGTPDDNNFSWATSFFDANNDGWEDLFIAAGLPYDHRPNALFLNGPGMALTNVAAEAGVANPADQRSMAYADYDNDGDIDFYIQTYKGVGQLFRNDNLPRARGNWLKVGLEGSAPNTFGIGARVRLQTPDGTWQTREIRAGSGLGGTDDVRAHFGIGTATSASVVEVHWPNGEVQRRTGVSANQTIMIDQDRESGGPIYLPLTVSRF